MLDYVCICLENAALLDFDSPTVGLQFVKVHDFVDRLLDLDVFFVAEYKRRNELVLLYRVAMISKNLAIITVNYWYLFAFVIGLIGYESLVYYFFIGEVGRKKLGHNKIDDIVIRDSKYLRHLC